MFKIKIERRLIRRTMTTPLGTQIGMSSTGPSPLLMGATGSSSISPPPVPVPISQPPVPVPIPPPVRPLQTFLLNTHYYDGKLGVKPPPNTLTLEEKKSQLNQFFTLLQPHLSPSAQSFFQLLVRDSGTPANYSSENQLWAEDVLLAIRDKLVSKTSGMKISDVGGFLGEQLQDIIGGMCPSGRSTRMYQVWYAL